MFANTKLVDIFPKPKQIITINETDKITEALSVIAQHSILSLPVYAKSSRNYNKFLDVLDIVSYIHEELKKKNISEKEASTMEKEELFNKAGLSNTTVSQVAATNTRANFYLFEGKAPARAVLDRMVLSNLHRVPIIDGEKELYGICSQTDLILFIHMHERLFDEYKTKTVQDMGIGFQKVHTISNTDTLMSAFTVIHEKHISGVGVVDEKGSLVGALSGSDVKLFGLNSENMHSLFLPYNQVVKEPRSPVYVVPSDSFSTVIDKMVSERVHRVFILDPQSKSPIGVLSQIDVLKAVHSNLK